MVDTPSLRTGLYSPSKWGSTFHALTVHEALGAGAAGPGKTQVLIMDPFHQIMTEHARCSNKNHPHHIPWGASRGWALHMRRTRPMILQTIDRARRIFNAVDDGVKYNDKDGIFTFSTGYRYQFGHCKDPNSWEIYMSSEYTWIGFDELIQFEYPQYENISARLRSSDPVLVDMLKVRAMSNPMQTAGGSVSANSDPTWVRKYFVQPAPEGGVVLKKKVTMFDGEEVYRTRIYLPATLEDNPDPIFRRSFEINLRGKSKYVQEALLKGNWYAVAGSFYGDDWDVNLHICEPFHIPEDWPRFRSMDWGYKAYGAVCWFAMDPDGNLYVEYELTFRLRDAAQVADDIKDIETHLGLWGEKQSQIIGPADDQLWEERGDTGMSKAESMRRKGVRWVKADKKSRTTNGQRLLARIKDHNRGTTRPGIIFFNRCRKCIQTIPAIETDPNSAETPLDGGEDHWHDTVLYGCAFASHGAKRIPSRRVEDDWTDDRHYEQQIEKSGSKGRYGYGEQY